MTAAAPAVDAIEEEAGRAQALRRLAAFAAVLAIGCVVGIVVLASGDARLQFDLNLVTLGFYASIVSFAVMGALIVQRRPTTRVAWLMLVAGIGVGLGLFGYSYGVAGHAPGPYAPLPFALPVLVVSGVFFIPSLGTTWTWILLLYPTDRILGPRWRWVGIAGIACGAAFVIGTLLVPGPIDEELLPGVDNPLGVPGDAGAALASLADVGNYAGLVFLTLAAVSLVVRYRTADLVVRAQIRWLAVVAVVAVVAFAVSLVPIDALGDLPFGLGMTLAASMPIAIGIAITRYRLYDIDRLINRALVYGSLTAILAGVFTAGVGLAQRLFINATGETSDGAIVGTTLVVATLYAPLRKRLETLVDRRFKFEQARFGAYRDELSKALTIREPERAALRLIGEAVRELELVGGAVLARDERVVAIAGMWPAQPVVRVPIRHGGEILHVLALGPRRDGDKPNPREVADLESLAELVAAAATGDAPNRS